MLRLDGGLFFATADALHDRLREVLETSNAPVHAVVLDLESVDFVDSQGAAKLSELEELAGRHDMTLRLTHVQAPVREILETDGVVSRGP